MFLYLLQGLGYGGAAAAQPGPFQAYLLSQTLKNGLRSTLVAALAPLMSDGPIVLLVLLVLTQMPDWFVAALRFGGGFFLLYLAYKAFRSAREMVVTAVTQPTTEKRQSIREAALMNMLSPNAYIFWSTIAGPIFLEGWRQAPTHGLAFMIGFYGALIGGFMGFVVLFGVLGQASPKLNRVLGFVSAVALFGFGLYQIWLGAQRFLV
ncbi:MAG: LysE family transporter [Ardenticatenaceae bacterium]|nr:LysE family transporter [Ardenticatenaceae bacterium]